MAGGKGPKRKGYTHEKRLVDMAVIAGLDASRAWGSDGRASGWHPEVDVNVAGWRIQAKARKTVNQDLLPSVNVDAVAIHPDRHEDLIVIRYTKFLELVSRGLSCLDKTTNSTTTN
jgi:hypothetical protein